MEYLLNQEILQILHRVQSTIETVLRRNKPIFSVNDYLLSESGMEKLDAACMLIQTIGENLPDGFQRSEFQLEHGFVDQVVPRTELKEVLTRILQLHTQGRKCR